MRLIDADALEKTLAAWVREHWTEAFTGDDAGSEFTDMINHEETVDPAKVVHAHWYFDPDKSIGSGITVSGMFCSNCGGDCPTGSHPYRDFKYCPHCGARIDEEKK